MKALAVVAHPDDETIWMGNQIKINKFDWTIFSLCRADDPDRHPKFLKVCEYYGAKHVITGLEDNRLDPADINKIIALICKNLKNKNYDIIYTHGENGEYGHIRHKEVHIAVKKMVKDRTLKAKKIFYFNYKKENGYCVPVKGSNFHELSKNELDEKKKIITRMYGFKAGSFEEKSSGDESFILR